MRTSVISQSPEEVCNSFFQHLKKYNLGHKVKVWSRKDTKLKDEELVILSLRDYNHLQKEKSLPSPYNTVVLFSEKNKLETHKLDPDQAMLCFIAGTEQERGILAAEYYMATHSLETMLPESLTWKNFSLESINSLQLPAWLKMKLGGIFVDLSPLDPKLFFTEVKDRILIKVHIPKLNSSPTSLMNTIRPLTLSDVFELPQLVLGKVFHECSYCLIDEREEKETILIISLLKTTSQKRFDSSAKMFGVIL